jgi:hypothetical protein
MDSQLDDLFFNSITELSNEPTNNNKVTTEDDKTNDKMKSKLPLIILGCTLILILFKK